MNTEDKMLAMQSLGYVNIFVTETDDPVSSRWRCSPNVEICGDGLARTIIGFGKSPEDAISDAWSTIISLPTDRWIRTFTDKRHLRWAGFMFKEV